MLDLSPEKVVVLAVIALVVFGPHRLPEMARKAGRVVAELRRMSGALEEELRGALNEPRHALGEALDEIGLTSIPRVPSVRRALTDTLVSAIDTTSQAARPAPPPSAAAAPELPGGLPVPDDPALN